MAFLNLRSTVVLFMCLYFHNTLSTANGRYVGGVPYIGAQLTTQDEKSTSEMLLELVQQLEKYCGTTSELDQDTCRNVLQYLLGNFNGVEALVNDEDEDERIASKILQEAEDIADGATFEIELKRASDKMQPHKRRFHLRSKSQPRSSDSSRSGKRKINLPRYGKREMELPRSGKRGFELLRHGKLAMDLPRSGKREYELPRYGKRTMELPRSGKREAEATLPRSGKREEGMLESVSRERELPRSGKREFALPRYGKRELNTALSGKRGIELQHPGKRENELMRSD